MHGFESVRGALPEKLKPEFDKIIREKMRAQALAKFRAQDSCKAACELAKNNDVWSKPEFISPKGTNHMSAYELAMQSMGALFLSKAAAFCEPAKKRWEELKKNWLGFPDCTEDGLKKVEAGLGLLRRMNQGRARPAYIQDVFAEAFWSLLLRDSSKDSTLPEVCRKALKARLEVAEKAHADYFAAAPKAEDDVKENDSLYTSYAASVSALSLPRPAAAMLGRMRAVLGAVGNPTRVPYYPRKQEETSRSAAARSPAFLLALYFHAATGAEKETLRKELIKTVHNFAEHVPSLSLHVGREETHIGEDNLAPYYFYSTMPYAIAATRLLVERSRDDAEKRGLEEVLGELTGTLLLKMEKNGVMRPMGERPTNEPPTPNGDYKESPGYCNPLSGLALLAVKPCTPGAAGMELGIVTLDLERVVPPSPAAKPKAEVAHSKLPSGTRED